MRLAKATQDGDTFKKGQIFAIEDEDDESFSIPESETIMHHDAFCMKNGCAHLNGGDWEITDAEVSTCPNPDCKGEDGAVTCRECAGGGLH